MRWIVPVSAVLVLAVASANASGTGISGRVTASPTCPVETMPPQPQCAPRGFKARVRVTRASDGKVVARITTGNEGRFRVALRPGRYRLLTRPAAGGKLPSCPNAQPVRVPRSGYKRVTIDCDSGIR